MVGCAFAVAVVDYRGVDESAGEGESVDESDVSL